MRGNHSHQLFHSERASNDGFRSNNNTSTMKQRTLSFFGKALFAGLVASLVSSQAMAQGPWNFRNGEAGYTGAKDTQIHQLAANQNTDYSAALVLNSDNEDGGGGNDVMILIRFDDIIGPAAGQIPAGTMIANATLVLRSTADDANSPGPVYVHRMVSDWTPTCTWASCFNADGVQADDVEANLSPDGQIVPDFPDPGPGSLVTYERTVDVTTTVQAWINGALPNFGWVLTNSSNNGYRIDSSETAAITNRPQLRVVASIGAPVFTVQPPANTTVLQCRTATISATVDGVPPIQYQWLYEVTPGNYQPVDSVANPSALTSSLVITNAQAANAGNYKLQAVNQGGSTDSTVAALTVTADGDGPVAIRAVVSADRTQITVSYNETVLASDGLGNDNAQDPFDYSIHEVGNPGNFLSVQQSPLPALVDGTNIVITIDPGGPQWVEGTSYEIDIAADIPDACTGVRSAGQTIGVNAPLTIREGLRGYAGTRDVELNSATPGTAVDVDPLVLDTDPQTQQVLLQFGDIFGGGPSQIPFGSTINSATLQINQTDPGTVATVYRMLQTWTEASTWDGFANGVQNDDVEARATASFTMPNAVNGLRTFNVTADMQAWSDGAANHGWAILPGGGDGFRFNSSETATEASRPTLTVEYTAAPCTTPTIIAHPAPSVTLEEGQTLTLTVSASGGCNLRYQWTRNGGDITGATSSTYTKANANPNDNGTYRVRVINDLGTVTSNPSTVTVNPDTVRPTLVRAAPQPDMTTIRLTYSEVMGASAGSSGNYTIPGLTVSSATIQPDGSNVVLVTSARTFRQTYTLTINNVRDDAIAGGGNLLNPNPTVVSIASDAQRIVGFHDQWFWNTNCQDFTGWETIAFDPAANGWPQGPGSFGFDDTAGTLTALANLGAQIQTPWTVNANLLAAYLRRSVTIPAGLNLSGGAQIIIRYLRDDGMLLYQDGAEVIRTSNMTNNPTYCTNLALNAAAVNITEGAPETNVLAMVAGQTYQVAVQIQQNATGSSDILFGAEIYAIFPQPRLTITHDATLNTITVSWTPAGGQLEESTNLSAPNQGFGNSLRQNGVAFANPGTTTFYRVRR